MQNHKISVKSIVFQWSISTAMQSEFIFIFWLETKMTVEKGIKCKVNASQGFCIKYFQKWTVLPLQSKLHSSWDVAWYFICFPVADPKGQFGCLWQLFLFPQRSVGPFWYQFVIFGTYWNRNVVIKMLQKIQCHILPWILGFTRQTFSQILPWNCINKVILL